MDLHSKSIEIVRSKCAVLFKEWWEKEKEHPTLKQVFESLYQEGDKERKWEGLVKAVAQKAFIDGAVHALDAAARGMTLLRSMGFPPPGSPPQIQEPM